MMVKHRHAHNLDADAKQSVIVVTDDERCQWLPAQYFRKAIKTLRQRQSDFGLVLSHDAESAFVAARNTVASQTSSAKYV